MSLEYNAYVMRILELSEPECRDSNVAGGKAANLARLWSDLPGAIPNGWVIPVDDVSSLCAVQSGAQATAREELAALLATRLTPDGIYAVRSSASDEDAGERSFAGQYTTILGVRSIGDIVRAIEKGVSSAQSPRVATYRRLSQSSERTPLAILIQEMVAAERSGVTFTVNPVTGAREIIVDASYGLGDVVVGGEVTPDEFVLDVELHTLRSRIGSKHRMTLIGPHGLVDQAVPEALRSRESLSGDQLRSVGALALRCEEGLGFPVDVEWAIARGVTYILQARPITASRSTR